MAAAALRIWKMGLFLSLVFTGLASNGSIRVSSSSVSPICPAASSIDSSILQTMMMEDLCLVSDFTSSSSAAGDDRVGVMEVDEVSLQRALNEVHMNGHEYVSLLFYATWCPFSKTLRSNFTILSSYFPTIRHFAVEESSVGPRMLSRYAVHGFPTLFLLNSTMRVRYHGSRALDSLFSFYDDVSGVKPASLDGMMFERIWDQLNLTKIVDTEQECPFSWARSPEKLLQQETYLALAITFVLLRLLHFLLPTLRVCFEQAWRWWMRNMNLSLWEHPLSCLQQAIQVLGSKKPCKRSNLQEGAMNAKAWASKSLATVSIGEASSSRACFGG
ncbi:hypothetical protein AAC387_Pa11g1305 [Persea americana]